MKNRPGSCLSNEPEDSKSRCKPLLRQLRLLAFLFCLQAVGQGRTATTTSLVLISGGQTVSAVQSATTVTLTASVKAGTNGITTGQVKFCDASAVDCSDIHLLGIAQLTPAGTASLKLRPANGTHTYKAVFLGTVKDAGSVSNSSSLSVTGIVPTATAITETGSPGSYTLMAEVGIPSQAASGATGEISFVDTTNNNSVLGTVALGPTVNTPILINVSNPATYNLPSLNLTGDFNGDGILDLAIGNTYAPNFVTVLLGDGTGNFTAAPNSPFSAVGVPVATQDFNGDGIADLLVSSLSGGAMEVVLGKGDGTFKAAPGSLTTLYGTYPVVVADFNGDGIPDIASAGAYYLTVFLGNGDGSFTSVPITAATYSEALFGSMAVGDLNSDGIPDLVATSNAQVVILFGKGDGTFTPAAGSAISADGSSQVAIADFNQDGKLDLALPYYNYGGSSSVSILLGKGDGTFQTAVTTPITVGTSPFLMGVGDFNGDGVVDLFLGAQVNGTTINILLGKGDGTFSLMPTGDAGLPCCSAAALGDFNGDGITDSASSSVYDNSAYILLTEPTQADATLTGVAVSPVGPADHFVTASYPGDGHYGASTATSVDVLAQAAAPVFTPTAGTYALPQTVTISDSTPGVTIAYTTDGSTPGSSYTATYSGPLTVLVSETIKAVATNSIYITSSVASAAYTITNPQAPAPVFIPAAGTYGFAQPVNFYDSLAGATIHYTVDGSTPTSSSTLYSSAIMVSSSETIKAIAVANGYTNSAVASATYSIVPTLGGLQFVPVTPCRVVDTRKATGPFGAPELGAGSSRAFDIPQSACSIPSSAVAYSLNVTVVPNGALGYLTMWPSGQTQPLVSTLNSDGRVKANAAIVPAGTKGGVSVFVTNPSQVILDIDGYFVPDGTASALAFYPVTPCRLVDTRNGNGTLGGPSLAGGSSRDFPVQSSSCGLPADAAAYSLNVTAIPHGPLNYLTMWPSGQTQPLVSTLNATTGGVTANAAIVPAGANGQVSVYVSDHADVVLDVNGYFATPSANGLSLHTTSPCRVIDTRNNEVAFIGELTVAVEDSVCAPTYAVQAWVLNATAVPLGPLNYLTLWPADETQPVVSTLNAVDGAVTSNMAIVPTSNGSIDAFFTSPTELVLDLSSYFAH